MRMPLITRRRLLFLGVVVFVVVGVIWIAAPRDAARQRAIAKYEQIRPGMTVEQVEDLMKDLPSDTCYFSDPDGYFHSASHRFNITANFDSAGALKGKHLIEYWESQGQEGFWLVAASRILGYREFRHWP